jgi:hypothetical protein
MAKFDPPSDPYGDEITCPFCDHGLEDKGMLSFHDWVCTNPDCQHSINYQEPEEDSVPLDPAARGKA